MRPSTTLQPPQSQALLDQHLYKRPQPMALIGHGALQSMMAYAATLQIKAVATCTPVRKIPSPSARSLCRVKCEILAWRIAWTTFRFRKSCSASSTDDLMQTECQTQDVQVRIGVQLVVRLREGRLELKSDLAPMPLYSFAFSHSKTDSANASAPLAIIQLKQPLYPSSILASLP